MAVQCCLTCRSPQDTDPRLAVRLAERTQHVGLLHGAEHLHVGPGRLVHEGCLGSAPQVWASHGCQQQRICQAPGLQRAAAYNESKPQECQGHELLPGRSYDPVCHPDKPIVAGRLVQAANHRCLSETPDGPASSGHRHTLDKHMLVNLWTWHCPPLRPDHDSPPGRCPRLQSSCPRTVRARSQLQRPRLQRWPSAWG